MDAPHRRHTMGSLPARRAQALGDFLGAPKTVSPCRAQGAPSAAVWLHGRCRRGPRAGWRRRPRRARGPPARARGAMVSLPAAGLAQGTPRSPGAGGGQVRGRARGGAPVHLARATRRSRFLGSECWVVKLSSLLCGHGRCSGLGSCVEARTADLSPRLPYVFKHN